MRGMRDTAFYWFRLPQGLLRGAATPLGMMTLAKGAGETGSKARHAIVERYRGDVFHYARSLARDKQIAEDVSQDFAVEFLDAGVYNRHDEKKGGFRAYLRGWIRNVIRARRKKAAGRREVPLDDVDTPARGKSPEEALDLLLTRTRIDEVREKTRVALAKVPHAWEAFDQWHFQRDANDGLTHEKLAETLGVSPRSIENLLDRARQAFILQFVHLVSPEVGVAEQMEEEVGLTRELLEKALARCWKDARPRKTRAPGREA